VYSPSSTTAMEGKKREDLRLLVPIEKRALLSRPEPFALRQELCVRITGLSLAAIPQIAPTHTGLAITPANLLTRDLLTTQENTEIVMSVLQGTAVNQPETWFNYAVPSVPTSMHRLLGGSTMNTAELVAEKAEAQTKVRPVGDKEQPCRKIEMIKQSWCSEPHTGS
jgi:hypothetical protein